MKFKLITPLLLLAAFPFYSFSQINWQTTNGPEGGVVLSILDDGQYAFVSDPYHFYRTNDGLNWEQLPGGNIWPLATSPTKLAAGKGNGYNYDPSVDYQFVVSYDHGSTWIEGSMPPITYDYFTSIAVCSSGVYVPDGYSGYIFRTQDDGLTWDSIPAPGMYCYDVWAFDDQVYAEWYSKFWRLSLDGSSWELVSPVFNNGDYPYSMFASDSLLFFATEHNLWCSSNFGASWTKTAVPFHNSSDHFCKIGNRVYKVAGSTGIMYTDNGGHSWHELPIANDFHTFEVATAGGELLCGTPNKGVLRYDAPNQQLVMNNEGLKSAAVYQLDSGNGQLWAACGNGVFAYDLAQETWVDKALLPLPKNNFNNVAVSPAGKIMATYSFSYGFYLSLDDGASWDTIVPSNPQNGLFMYVNKLFWVGENILLTSDWGESAWSTDLGLTWEFGTFPEDIVFFAGRYYGLSWPGGLLSSDDFGLTWHPEANPNFAFSSVSALYATDDKLFILSTNNMGRSQIHSTSDVNTWTYSSDGLPQIDVYNPVYEPYTGGIWHKGDRYYLHQQSIGFFTSLDSCKTWLPLERVGGVIDAVDTTFFRAGYGGGVLKTGLPQNYGALSTGHVFKDDNNNSVWDPNEAALPNLSVSITEPGAWYPFWFINTDSDGRYALGSLPGSIDTLRLHIPSAYIENINPPYHVVTNTGDNRNFGVHFQQDITDVSITGYFAGRPRPGFPLDVHIGYRNEGTVPANGIISVKLDPHFQFASADPQPTSVIGDSLIWDFNLISLFDQHWIRINGMLDPATVLGSPFKITGHIEPAVPDFMPANNHFMRIDTVVGSYDPNEKRVEPAEGLTPAEIAQGKELVYSVHFQNTGNYQADRVRITDMLDTALDVSTLRLVASSHPVSTFRLLPGNLLEVIFEQIALPDSNSNELASHGFVSFAIQCNKAFNPYYNIRNTAGIYFDFNEPIITNTVFSPVVQPTVSSFEPGSPHTKQADLLISPNPAANDFLVDTRGRLSGAGDIVLIDAQGKICFSLQGVQLSNPVHLTSTGLTDGSYIIRVAGSNGVMFGKLVIAR